MHALSSWLVTSIPFFYPKIIHFGCSGRLQDMCDWFSIESTRDYKEPFT